MERLQRLLQSGGGMMMPGMQPGMDVPTNDTAEVVHISSLALLKVGGAGLDQARRGLVDDGALMRWAWLLPGVRRGCLDVEAW